MLEAIIFDWSGVLSDEFEATFLTSNEIMRERGFKGLSMKEFKEAYELPWENFYKKQGLPFDAEQESRDWRQKAPKNYSKLKPFRKAKETLEWLKARGIKTIVFSSRNKSLLEKEIAMFGFEGLIDEAFAENFDKKQGIEKLILEKGMKKEKTLFVGDTVHDIETARFAGLRSVAVTSGFQPKEKILAAKPDFVIKDVSGLTKLIEKIEPNVKKKEEIETKIIDGKKAHVVVVALAEIGKKLVLLDRTFPIKGTSLIIGHVKKGENESAALEREALEETGGKILEKNFIGERVYNYGWKCTRGASLHVWRVYKVTIDELRNKEIDEGKLLLVPFEKVPEQSLTPIARQALTEFGYIK